MMLRHPIPWRWHVALGMSSFLALIALYTLLSWQRQRSNPEDRIIPNWSQIYHEGLLETITPDSSTNKVQLWEDAKASGYRFLIALTCIVLVSVPIGLLMGCYEPVEGLSLPALYFWSKIPGSALLSIILIFVGLADPALYVTMVFFGVFPTLAQTIFHAAREDVPQELLFKARTLGASQLACIWDVIYKHTLPKVIEGVRLSIGPALVYLIMTEMVFGDVGMGCHLRLVGRRGAVGMPVILVYVFVLGVFGLGMDFLFRWLQRKLCPWYGQ
jgi:NitT/TauT family transport system permease protein